MLENWDFSRRSRKAVLDTFLSIFRILRTSKSSQRYENYNTFILMKSQTSFVRSYLSLQIHKIKGSILDPISEGAGKIFLVGLPFTLQREAVHLKAI